MSRRPGRFAQDSIDGADASTPLATVLSWYAAGANAIGLDALVHLDSIHACRERALRLELAEAEARLGKLLLRDAKKARAARGERRRLASDAYDFKSQGASATMEKGVAKFVTAWLHDKTLGFPRPATVAPLKDLFLAYRLWVRAGATYPLCASQSRFTSLLKTTLGNRGYGSARVACESLICWAPRSASDHGYSEPVSHQRISVVFAPGAVGLVPTGSAPSLRRELLSREVRAFQGRLATFVQTYSRASSGG